MFNFKLKLLQFYLSEVGLMKISIISCLKKFWGCETIR